MIGEKEAGITELPDGTRLYNREYIEALLKNKESFEDFLLVRDVILNLLARGDGKPIYGRIMLMKQIFLTYEEIIKPHDLKFQDPKYIPYKFGPYSFFVAEVLDDLRFSKFIKVEGKKNTRKESFEITAEGLRDLAERKSSIPEELLVLMEENRVAWDILGTDGMLKYVYLHYDKFKEKSLIKDKYKVISWGKGKG